MKKLPVLISVPHGGAEIPPEIRARVNITPPDLFADSDAFTREIYGIEESIAAYLDTPFARAFIDMNRDTNDLPPGNLDGIIKTRTCHGKSIYIPGQELSTENIIPLLENYYHPYHNIIRQTLAHHPEIRLGLDCHSMEPIGPETAPDPGQKRPAICLGTNRGKSCAPDMAAKLAECFQSAFKLDASEVTIDKPFAGGFITRTYGNQPVPWIQVELNRNLYLSEPWFDSKRLIIKQSRLNELRDKFQHALALFPGF